MDGFFVRGRDYPPLVPPASRTHKARPINDQPIGLGFPRRAGRCRPGKRPTSQIILATHQRIGYIFQEKLAVSAFF